MINLDDRLLAQCDEKELWLMLHIAKRIGENASSFPSIATLMADTGWGRTQVKDVKNRCIEKRFISVKERKTDKGQSSNLYFIETDYLSVMVKMKGRGGRQEADTPVATATTPRSQERPAPGRHSDHPPVATATTEVLTSEVLTNEQFIIVERANDSEEIFEEKKGTSMAGAADPGIPYDVPHVEPWQPFSVAAELGAMASDSRLMEAVCMSRKIPAEKFDEYFSAFVIDIAAREETYPNRAALRSHFLNFCGSRYRAESKVSERRDAKHFKPGGKMQTLEIPDDIDYTRPQYF